MRDILLREPLVELREKISEHYLGETNTVKAAFTSNQAREEFKSDLEAIGHLLTQATLSKIFGAELPVLSESLQRTLTTARDCLEVDPNERERAKDFLSAMKKTKELNLVSLAANLEKKEKQSWQKKIEKVHENIEAVNKLFHEMALEERVNEALIRLQKHFTIL